MYDTALWYTHQPHSSWTHKIKLKATKSVLKDNLSLKMPGSLQRDISVLTVNSGTVTAALLESTPTKSSPLKTFHSLLLQLSARSTYAGIIKCLHENAGTRIIEQLHCSPLWGLPWLSLEPPSAFLVRRIKSKITLSKLKQFCKYLLPLSPEPSSQPWSQFTNHSTHYNGYFEPPNNFKHM